jgi:outer membrane protein assembly factor BamB
MVAIKEMTNQVRDKGLKEVYYKNFEREANILASLNHPAVPMVYDFFEQGENVYLVMEFIQGKDLEDIVNNKDNELPEELITGWGIELCDVLHYLHNHQPEPIIFRDIKPSNIMVNQFGRIVLVDFGIAKAFQTGQKGTMMGTEGYSPPEQYRGEATQLVDIYALGATMHHLLTRIDPQQEPPFTFNERVIHEINPRVSLELEGIVYKALEYHPENRYQTALEMKQALVGLARRAFPTGPIATAVKPAPIPTINNGHKPMWTFVCEDEIRGSAAYDSGSVFIGALDSNLYALEAATGKYQWKYPTGGAIVGRPEVKERLLYFGSEDNKLHVVNSGTGKVLWTYNTGGYVRSSVSLSDNYAFSGSDDGYLHALNVKSGRRAWRFQAGSPIRSTPIFYANLVFFGSEGGDFYCLDMFSSPKWHFRAKRAITSSPAVWKDLVIFGAMDSILYAIDARMGWEVWRHRLGKGTISSPAVDGDRIYIGATDGVIYCIDGNTAREVWRFKTEHQVNSSPMVTDEYVFCGSVDGNFYCLEKPTGRLIWKYDTQKPITGSPLVVDDYVFIGSTNHRFYAFMMS